MSQSTSMSVFFFQAEDGIRAFHVTGVQTCALPIWLSSGGAEYRGSLNSAYMESAMDLTVSRPTRSVSASGPIGWAQPSTMALSTSSLVANPDATMRMAESR